MWELLKAVFSPRQYVPHGHCYLWQTPLVGLHVVSDLLIAIAYFSIPVMLIYFVRQRSDVPFLKVFFLFGAFILLCGTGHLLEIWTLWQPAYWLSGSEKALTALVSCYTGLQMVELLPQFLTLQTPKQLEAINRELELRVQERTAELVAANAALQQMAEGERAIAKVMRQMRQTLELPTIFSATTAELRQAINSDRVLVYRFNPDGSGELVSESVAEGWTLLVQEQPNSNLARVAGSNVDCTVKTSGSANTLVQDIYLQETQGGVYHQGTSYRCVPDIYEAGFDSCYIELLEQFQVRAYLIVPILSSNNLWGLLATSQNSGPRHWQEAEIRLVAQIGTQLGVAVQQAELLAQTQQQSAELKAAKEAADAANRAKSEFLAKMSHELRTPLNAILGFTQLMHLDATLSKQQQQYVRVISSSGEHLLKLINDILELSKIEAGQIVLNEKDFDLYYLLACLEGMLRLKADLQGLQLTFEYSMEVPQLVRTDENKLRQVLINLLGNGIKFTQMGSVTLRVKRGSGEETHSTPYSLLFEVEDTGPGIAPDQLDQLFQLFTQTETGLNANEGTGLGLAISQKFVQLMGGEITVESLLGRGSKFAFTIPVKATEQAQIQIPQRSEKKAIGLAPDQPVYRILVVDDELTNRLLLVKLLKPLGFEVREADNGRDAIAQWQQWEPHLIWMDMQMPLMNGYEATQHIKASLKGQATVIIALTASAFEEQRQEILSTGCDDLVRKPFHIEEVLEKMAKYIGVRYLYEALEGNKEKMKSPTQSALLNATALSSMPAAWIEQLHKAAAIGSDLQLLGLIEQISPKQSSLVKRVFEKLVRE